MEILVRKPLIKVSKVSLAYLLIIELRKLWLDINFLSLGYLELHCAAELLRRNVLAGDHWEVEAKLDETTSCCYQEQDNLKFIANEKSYLISYKEAVKLTNLEQFEPLVFQHLLSAHLIRQGFTVVESPGQVIKIIGTKGVEHSNNRSYCSCGGTVAEPCKHLILSEIYLRYRLLFNKYGIGQQLA